MCCFTRPVRSVSKTRIFARAEDDQRQFLAYAMQVDADEPLAMVLPLPLPPDPAEDAVRFIDLSDASHLFERLEACFDPPRRLRNPLMKSGPRVPPTPLEVVEVGAFVASFVPSAADFGRLDPRFRLPRKALEALPDLEGCGFAVFELAEGRQRIHPMGLSLPRVDPSRLFFPTVHVHDGAVESMATFDHVLYAQFTRRERRDRGQPFPWIESRKVAGARISVENTAGMVEAGGHVYKKPLRGSMPNADTWA